MIRFFIIPFLLLSSFEVNAQYHLKTIHSRLIINIDTNQNNRLIMRLNLHDGIPNDTFYIQQSFKDNPSYLTTRAKGKFFNGLLSDSLIIYNNRAQIIEKGKFKTFTGIHSRVIPVRLDTVTGFGRYGLRGYRDGIFTYFKSGKNYTNYKKEAEIEYKNGLLHGKNIHFHPDGTVHTSDTYFRDTLHGEHLIKYSDGITEEIGCYKMGIKDSLWMSYHTNGQLNDSCFYKKDECFSDGKGYYENGQLHYIVPRKDGKLHGTSINYYSDGKLKSKTNFVNDQYEGESTSWYHNGQLELKTFYENGIYTGEYDYFDSLGNTKYLGSSQNGVLMPDYINAKYEFVPPVFYYHPTELNIPYQLNKKQIKLLKKAENSLFELDIQNKKVVRLTFAETPKEISIKTQMKIVHFLFTHITTPGIFYNHSYYGGTVTFRIDEVHLHTKGWNPEEDR